MLPTPHMLPKTYENNCIDVHLKPGSEFFLRNHSSPDGFRAKRVILRK